MCNHHDVNHEPSHDHYHTSSDPNDYHDGHDPKGGHAIHYHDSTGGIVIRFAARAVHYSADGYSEYDLAWDG